MNSKSSGRKKILLIGWDAADWDHINPLLEQGLLPHLEKFINNGVMGNLATLQPILSPMLWNSAVTGKYAYKHGIHGFVEPDKHNGGYRPFSSYSRKCKALWNIFSQQGLKSNVINWWASHPAEPVDGVIVSNLVNGVKLGKDEPVVPGGTVHPESKSKIYGQFKVNAHEINAEQICAFIPNADRINQDEDSRLQMFANVLSETLTTHAVATAVMENEPWDFMAVYYTCIDHFGHGFMPYFPPRMPQVSEEDFEIFKDVMGGAYRFSDLMLGRLMELAGDDAIVILCSDHGFLSGDTRPLGQPREPAGPAVWHRRFGVFLMQGPGIKKDELIYGASLIDIAPTILVAAGMPIAADMDGRPLLEVFEEEPEVAKIDSWETVDGEFDSGMHKEEKPLNPEEAEELVQQFIALGYIEDPLEGKEAQFISAEIECQYNLARNLMYAERSKDAIPIFEELVRRSPWETRFIVQLVQAYQKGGYLTQAVQVIESAFDLQSTRYVLMRIVWVELQLAIGKMSHVDLVRELEQIELRSHTSPTFLVRIGQTYAKMRRWEEAKRAYLKVVELDSENSDAWQGLSRVYCRLGKNQETVDAALTAVSLVHRLPHSHLNLGIALARSGRSEQAVTSFHTALQFSPGFVPAHRWLSTVYRTALNEQELATHHANLVEKFSTKQADLGPIRKERLERVVDLPDFPTESERNETLLKERPDQVDPRKPSGKSFVVVSGLPRSGTSLMMQILEAGGMEPKTDGERIADSDNPKGYYEWEAIKQIKSNPNLMLEEGLEDKAIKAVTMIMNDIPYAHTYKVIFMIRSVKEVVASQRKMTARLDTHGADQTDEELARSLANHRNHVLGRLRSNTRIELLEVDYATLVENPKEMCELVASFVGADKLPDAENMPGVVDPSLRRQKS